MNKNSGYIIWYTKQVVSLFSALLKVREKALVLKNLFALIIQKANIVISFDSKSRFEINDFYDLLALYEIFCKRSYKDLFAGNKITKTTFLDIGAYNGDSTIFASRYPFIKNIIAIEPLPQNFRLLNKNISLNKIKNIKVLNMAVSSSDKITMYIYKNRRQTGINRSNLKRKRFQIEGISLSKLISHISGNIFVKCDAEGAEYDIFLKTRPNILKKIDRVMIEYHSGGDLDKMILHLQKSGMQVNINKSNYIDGFGYIYGYRK